MTAQKTYRTEFKMRKEQNVIIILTLVVLSCNISLQRTRGNTNNFPEIVNTRYEILDTNTLKLYENALNPKTLQKQNIDDTYGKYHIKGFYHTGNYELIKFDSNGLIVEEIRKVIEEGSTSAIFYVNKFIDRDSIIQLQKIFYSNGHLKQKRAFCILGFDIGKNIIFSADGKVQNVVNTDSGYRISYLQIFAFCRKKGLKLTRKKSDLQTQHLTILKSFPSDSVKNWSVIFPDFKNRKTVIYIINGLSGKIAKRESELHKYIEY